MNVLDEILLVTAACGLLMIAGGIYLLAKGAIRLEVASKDPALTLDLFQSQFKMSTSYPALGIFGFGLVFCIVALYYAKSIEEGKAPEVRVTGEAKEVQEQVTVMIRTEWSIPSYGGQIAHVLRPQFDYLWVQISAPGYEQINRPISRASMQDGIRLGSFKMHKVVDRIEPTPQKIAPLPAGTQVVPLTQGGSFGGVR